MTKESVIEQHGSEVISVARAKELLQGLNDKQNKTVQLGQLPVDFSTLLSYSVEDPLDSEKTVTKTFKVGDRVIVTDMENGEEEYDHLVVYTLMKKYKDGSLTTRVYVIDVKKNVVTYFNKNTVSPTSKIFTCFRIFNIRFH